jgi:hypothetical protein
MPTTARILIGKPGRNCSAPGLKAQSGLTNPDPTAGYGYPAGASKTNSGESILIYCLSHQIA